MKSNYSFSDGNTASILDNLNTAVFRTSLDGSHSIIDVNPAFIKMFGYKDRAELEYVPILDFYNDPGDRAKIHEELVLRGEFRDREIWLKRKDGSIFLGRVSSVLVKDSQGNDLFIDGVMDDISELKTKEMELVAERQVFLNGPVVLIQWPLIEQESLINISENVKDLLGYAASEFLEGKVLYPELVHEDDRAELQHHIRSVLADGSDVMLVHPYRLRQKGGEYIWVQDYAYVQRNEAGEATGILGYIYDVTTQQISQRESLEQERRLRNLVENSPTGIMRIDLEGNIVESNQRMTDMLGSPSKEALQMLNVFNLPHLKDIGLDAKYRECMQGNKIISFAGDIVSKWGKQIYFKIIISPVLNAEGVVIGAQSNMEDLTDTYLAEADKIKLQKAQLEERRIFMAGPVMIIKWGYSVEDPLLYVSENVEKILGYTVEEFLSDEITPTKIIHPDDIAQVRVDARRALEEGANAFEPSPYRLRKKDGCYIWVSDYSMLDRDAEDKPVAFSGIIWDISNVIEAERELELLLREVHHRVKNNMQVIISLLNIQADYVGDERLSEIFGETQNRIRSMSLIHDKLFRSKRMSAVDFGSYLSSLIFELNNFYKVDASRIQIHQEIEEIKLDISKAIPCGLIVNELVTNAIKYAFPNKREGEICVSAGVSPGNEAKIEIADNGVGLGVDVVFSEAQSMGLRIVRILTEQLAGTITIDHTNGTKFTLTFGLVE